MKQQRTVVADNRLYESAYAALRARKFDVALKRFSELAASGSPDAWISLGWMHQHAAGVPRNFREAEDCYTKAIALGHIPANFHLARLLVRKRAYKDAFAYFSVAADKGHIPSTYWLGILYLKGEGIDKDVSKAEVYLKRAAESGHLFARRDYNLALLRGIFGKREWLSNLAGWLRALWAIPKQAKDDSNSELLQ